MSQSVVEYCRVLQGVAGCCRVSQGVALLESPHWSQCVAKHNSCNIYDPYSIILVKNIGKPSYCVLYLLLGSVAPARGGGKGGGCPSNVEKDGPRNSSKFDEKIGRGGGYPSQM